MPTSKIKDTNLLLQIIKESRSDFSVIREAISNSFDAGAEKMDIYITQNISDLNGRLDIVFLDDGSGMSDDEQCPPSIFNFFNIADSGKTGRSQIGEKGVGTKLFFNSFKLEVLTKKPGEEEHYWVMEKPIECLEAGKMPDFRNISKPQGIELMDIAQGTTIRITGLQVYNTSSFVYDDRRSMLLKDYINFFTAAGNVRQYLKDLSPQKFTVSVYRWESGQSKKNSPDFSISEHIFPKDNLKPIKNNMIEPEDFVYRFGPITTNLYYYDDADGNKIKKRLNKIITILGVICGSSGHQVESGGQQLKGLFLAKDGFIVRRYNDIINDQSWYNYRIIANCQEIELNLGRDDFKNMSGEVFHAINTTLKDFITSVGKWRLAENYNNDKAIAWQSNDYQKNKMLPNNTQCPPANGIEQPGVPFAEEGYRLLSKQKNEAELEERIRNMNIIKMKYDNEIQKKTNKYVPLPIGLIKGIFYEPQNENSTILIFQSLLENKIKYCVNGNLWFDFNKYKIIQHFHEGVDFLVAKEENNLVELLWIEAEYLLKNALTHDHPVSSLYAIVCWDLDIGIKNQLLQNNQAIFTNKSLPYLIMKDPFGYYISGNNLNQRVKVVVLRKIYADLGMPVEPNYKENNGAIV